MSLIPQFLGQVCPAFSSINTEAHVLKVDLPGMKKEEVKVEVEDGGRVLHISGHRPEQNAKAEKMKAVMENGVLTLTIPKKEMKNPEVKQIEIVTSS